MRVARSHHGPTLAACRQRFGWAAAAGAVLITTAACGGDEPSAAASEASQNSAPAADPGAGADDSDETSEPDEDSTADGAEDAAGTTDTVDDGTDGPDEGDDTDVASGVFDTSALPDPAGDAIGIDEDLASTQPYAWVVDDALGDAAEDAGMLVYFATHECHIGVTDMSWPDRGTGDGATTESLVASLGDVESQVPDDGTVVQVGVPPITIAASDDAGAIEFIGTAHEGAPMSSVSYVRVHVAAEWAYLIGARCEPGEDPLPVLASGLERFSLEPAL